MVQPSVFLEGLGALAREERPDRLGRVPERGIRGVHLDPREDRDHLLAEPGAEELVVEGELEQESRSSPASAPRRRRGTAGELVGGLFGLDQDVADLRTVAVDDDELVSLPRIGRSWRTASRARSSCCAVVPESSGRSSALPPNATTASGRTKEKKGVRIHLGRRDRRRTGRPLSSLPPSQVASHALRSSRTSGIVMQRGPPRARESSWAASRIAYFLAASTAPAPPAEEEVVFVDDLVTRPGELFRGALVAVVDEDHAGRQREGVRAVGPLLAPLRDRVVAAAADRPQVELLRLQRREQVLLGRPGDLALASGRTRRRRPPRRRPAGSSARRPGTRPARSS